MQHGEKKPRVRDLSRAHFRILSHFLGGKLNREGGTGLMLMRVQVDSTTIILLIPRDLPFIITTSLRSVHLSSRTFQGSAAWRGSQDDQLSGTSDRPTVPNGGGPSVSSLPAEKQSPHQGFRTSSSQQIDHDAFYLSCLWKHPECC